MVLTRIPMVMLVVLLAFAAGLFASDAAPALAMHIGSVSAGGQHTCVLTWRDGAKCWGRNHFGQLGNGATDENTANPPADVVGLTSGLVQISAGGVHTCAVTAAGGVKCWGDGYDGQLGNGGLSDSPVPVDVDGLSSGVAEVFTGFNTTCAITNAGALKCWGAGFGSTPQDVAGLTSGVAYVSVGIGFECVRTTTGAAKCFGANARGQLGDGQACGSSCSSPVTVTGLGSGVAGLTGGEDFTCAKTSGGVVKCWGGNDGGQLGDGNACGADYCTTPVTVSGLAGVTVQSIADDTSSVGLHACIVTTTHEVRCWGFDYFGQVDGVAGILSRATPVAAPVTGDIAAVGAGGIHTCSQSTAGSVRCWGDDRYGQSASYDGDGDGCADSREFGSDPAQGGMRDAFNPWDYFNPTGDRTNRSDDITAVVLHYGHDSGTPQGSDYDAKYDRTALPGGHPWQFGPPNGTIRAADISAAVSSYGQDCA